MTEGGAEDDVPAPEAEPDNGRAPTLPGVLADGADRAAGPDARGAVPLRAGWAELGAGGALGPEGVDPALA